MSTSDWISIIDNRSPLDNIAESDGEEQDLDADQPVDFSNTSAKIAPRFSILGEFLNYKANTAVLINTGFWFNKHRFVV